MRLLSAKWRNTSLMPTRRDMLKMLLSGAYGIPAGSLSQGADPNIALTQEQVSRLVAQFMNDAQDTGTPSVAPSLLPADDFIGTTRHKIKMIRTEATSINLIAGSTLTLADIPGSGIVTTVWMALGEPVPRDDDVISIYVDGETEPSITFDAGSLGLRNIDGFSTVSCRHVAVEDGHSFAITFPIPYGNGIRIDITNPTAIDGSVFAQIFYTDEITDPRRLKSASRTWANKATVLANSAYEFLDFQGSGTLVWHSLIQEGRTKIAFLETDFNVTVDGELTIQNTGVEDWFLSGWYFQGGRRSRDYAFVSHINKKELKVSAGVDFLALFGGIKFSESINLSWDFEESDSDVDVSYLILYYVGQPPPESAQVGGSLRSVGRFADPRPEQPHSGDEYLATDGWFREIYHDGRWHPYLDGFQLTRPPEAASWTKVNLGRATVSDDAGTLLLTAPYSIGDQLHLVTHAAPLLPYTLVALLEIVMPTETDLFAGLLLRNQSSGKLITFGVSNQPTLRLCAMKYDNPTTYVDDYSPVSLPSQIPYRLWLRIQNDAHERDYSWSFDGRIFFKAFADDSASDFTAEDEVGLCVNATANTTPGLSLRLLSWEET
ncbi:MAG: DUF2961 domain-containing protein [Chloroflexi bacterium]|nr:DUF2961 domain-containing protein [Chloroflexota bacterium]